MNHLTNPSRSEREANTRLSPSHSGLGLVTGSASSHQSASIDETRSLRESDVVRSSAGGKPHTGRTDYRSAPRIDEQLIRAAQELIESIESSEPVNAQLNLTALASTVLEMWETAADASRWHQDVLAALENAVIQANEVGQLSPEQARGLREALTDLSASLLVREHAEVVRARLIRSGFAPIPYGDELDAEHD